MSESLFQCGTWPVSSLPSLLSFPTVELPAWVSHGMEQHNAQVNIGLYFKPRTEGFGFLYILSV